MASRESTQKKLGRIRPPRVHITYDVETGGAIEKKELPFVVGVLADLSGQPDKPLPRFKDRKFIEIDRDNVDQVIAKQTPRLAYKVENKLKNDGTNLGPGSPTIHFHQRRAPEIEVRLILKGGGCENVGAQYSLPNEKLQANRDLDGCRKVILDAVLQAQGKGCGPGILGVCIGGDRATSYEFSKQQFLRKLPDRNNVPELDRLEQDILNTANELGIGPMGFGGKTTLLGVKIGAANRLPASYFVSVSYMCWAFRRHGVRLGANGEIEQWLY